MPDLTPEALAAELEELATAALDAVDEAEDKGARYLASYHRGQHDACTGFAQLLRDRLAPAHAALTGQLTVMTAARDDLARELDKALAELAQARAALTEIADPTASFTWDGGTDPPADRLGRINHAREALEGGR